MYTDKLTYEEFRYLKQLSKRAAELRRNITLAEGRLWKQLRKGRLQGYKFRRQYPILFYIPDFYCPAFKLIIEVDGLIHNRAKQKQYDERKDRILTQNGYEVIRFTNEQVLNEISLVLQVITDKIAALQSLSFLGKGGRRPDRVEVEQKEVVNKRG